MATASSIAQKFASEGLDLILGVATPTTQAVVKADKTTPIVFTAVTDPVGAGLVDERRGSDGATSPASATCCRCSRTWTSSSRSCRT